MIHLCDNAVTTGLTIINLFDYTNATTWKMANSQSFTNNATTTTNFNWALNNAFYNQIDAITSLTYLCNSGDMTSGTALLYGVS